MKISAIVPTRNREHELFTLLAALGRQTRRPDEVVIVDASDSSLAEILHADTIAASSLNLKYIQAARGVNRQRNLGARQSTGDLLFFFDDDVVPEPDYIETLTDTFERHPEYHAGMGGLAPTLRRWSPGSILSMVFMLQHEYGDGRFYWSGMPRHPYGTRRFRDVEVLGGGLLAVRRTVFAQDGIEFDERLAHSQTDVDFSRRLSRRHRVFFDPRPGIHHGRSLRERPSMFEQGRRYMFNFRYLYLKNFYPFSPWTLPAHWWAVLGLFVVAAVTRSWERLRGYAAGLSEFARMTRGQSAGIFESEGQRE